MLFVSQGCSNLTGYAPEALLNNTKISFSQLIHPEERTLVQETVKRSLEHNRPFRIIYRLVTADQQVRWVLEQGSGIQNEDGKFDILEGFITDITEQKQAEEEIKGFNLNLEEKVRKRTVQLDSVNKELEAFSYSVSHDLRAPLRAIDGFSRILLEDHSSKLDQEGQRLLNVIRENTTKMGQLISNLLTLSRMGRAKLAFEQVCLQELAQNLIEEIKLTPQNRNISLQMKEVPPALGDKSMLRQVLQNLLTNAVKFTRHKEEAIIEVGGRYEGNFNTYYIKDNGVGFDMKYVDKLFGVFQRLHSENEFEGTGVGLATVQRIVHKHGGQVWAEGQLNRGATFYFTLPSIEGHHE